MITSPCFFSPQGNLWALRFSATANCSPSPLPRRPPTSCPTGWWCCWKAPESPCPPTLRPSRFSSTTPDSRHAITSKSGKFRLHHPSGFRKLCSPPLFCNALFTRSPADGCAGWIPKQLSNAQSVYSWLSIATRMCVSQYSPQFLCIFSKMHISCQVPTKPGFRTHFWQDLPVPSKSYGVWEWASATSQLLCQQPSCLPGTEAASVTFSHF